GRDRHSRWTIVGWLKTALQTRHFVEIATNAKAAITAEISCMIVDRQTRHFDPKPAAAIDRPLQGDAAPGAARRNRLGDAVFRIQIEGLGDFTPWAPETGGGVHANQVGELIAADGEAAIGIHLPHEAERKARRLCRRLESRRPVRRRLRDRWWGRS